MCVSVWVTPGTLFSPPGMTSASSSWLRTRTMATRSNSPVTEYTSLTSAISAILAPTSGIRWMSALTNTIAVTTAASLLRAPPGARRRSGYRQPVAEVVQGAHPQQSQPGDEYVQHRRGGPRVGQRTVGRRGRRLEVSGQRAELAVRYLAR